VIKILIADDEPRFREYLKKAINWQEYGFEICGEARNGAEAFEIAASTRPDIALLDINMPLMDGITLTEKLKETVEGISIVLITGHSEFEYARRALKLGVEDYVLKPFRKDELLSTLIKLRIRLQKIREEEEQARDDEAFLRERFLNMLIGDENDAGDEEILKMFLRHGIDVYSGFFTVASVEIDNMYQLWTGAGEISLWKFAVSNMLGEVVRPDGSHMVFNGPEGRIVSIINFKDEAAMKRFKTDAYSRLCDLVGKLLDFTITVGIGRPAYSFKDIRASYLETVLALQNKTVEGCGRVIEYSALIEGDRKPGFYRIELNDKILMALRMNEMDEIQEGLNQVLEYIKGSRLSIDYAYTIMMGLVSICLSYITEMGGDIESVLGKDFSPLTGIKGKTSLEESFNRLMDIFKKTSESFREGRTTRTSKIVDSVKGYIRQNYMDSELSVEKIARNIYLDSSYIRKVFAKELNTTVVDFITNVRMLKAKELLQSGNLKLADLSEMVGYSDPGYFSKCFKKHFGMSPSEYVNSRGVLHLG
jgi:two-component system response regulator YesN